MRMSELRCKDISLYGQYILEREGKYIVEDSRGFATYTYIGDSAVYIEEIYVMPEYRQSGVATAYADTIADFVKPKGIRKLIGSVSPAAKNSTVSMKALLAYGFNITSSEPGIVYLTKEIV